MTPEEKAARLNLVRYGMVLLVVLAITITPISLFLATARAGEPATSVIPATLIATLIAAVVGVVGYFGYSKYIAR